MRESVWCGSLLLDYLLSTTICSSAMFLQESSLHFSQRPTEPCCVHASTAFPVPIHLLVDVWSKALTRCIPGLFLRTGFPMSNWGGGRQHLLRGRTSLLLACLGWITKLQVASLRDTDPRHASCVCLGLPLTLMRFGVVFILHYIENHY